jgi:LysM repeat protein
VDSLNAQLGFFAGCAFYFRKKITMSCKLIRFFCFVIVLIGIASSPGPVFAEYGLPRQVIGAKRLSLDQAGQATATPATGIVTSTPRPDGAIIHVVGSGQSLWAIAIAYGVKINDILKLNNLPPTTTVVYVGQKLTIRKADPASLTPTITPTHPAITLTPTVSRIPKTATPAPTASQSPTVTASPTATPWISALIPNLSGNQKYVGYGLITLCVLGLLWVLFTGFRKK